MKARAAPRAEKRVDCRSISKPIGTLQTSWRAGRHGLFHLTPVALVMMPPTLANAIALW